LLFFFVYDIRTTAEGRYIWKQKGRNASARNELQEISAITNLMARVVTGAKHVEGLL
jgi:hypothetical protein